MKSVLNQDQVSQIERIMGSVNLAYREAIKIAKVMEIIYMNDVENPQNIAARQPMQKVNSSEKSVEKDPVQGK